MKAFGFDRTYSKCRVIRAVPGTKIIVTIFVKNRKAGRICYRFPHADSLQA